MLLKKLNAVISKEMQVIFNNERKIEFSTSSVTLGSYPVTAGSLFK